MINPGDKIVVALSGGADSVALFYLLKSIEKDYKLKLYIAHINHLFRGESADRDEHFVRKIGEKNEVESFILRKKVEDYARNKKIGFEEAGREVRYAFFDEVKRKTGADKIAIAHNADDNVETFLFRLMRGSSISGLASIPERRDCYIRPIIKFFKKEIFMYLKENNLEYVNDETNFDLKYTRNRIRGELIPYVEEKFNPEFKEKIISLIEEIESLKSDMQEEVEKVIEGNKLNADKMTNLSCFKRKYLLNEFFKKNEAEVSRKILEKVEKLVDNGGTLHYNLPNKKILKICYSKLEIIDSLKNEKVVTEEREIGFEDKVVYLDFIIETSFTEKITDKSKNVFYVDYDLVKDKKLKLRTRRAGDYFFPKGTSYKKKINDFFIDIKLEKDKRDSIPLIISDNEIIWIAGIRESEKYKATEGKKMVKFIIKEEK